MKLLVPLERSQYVRLARLARTERRDAAAQAALLIERALPPLAEHDQPAPPFRRRRAVRPPDRPDRPLLSVSEAARLAGVTQSSAYRWLAAGDVPAHVYLRLGGRLYVRRAAFARWLDGESEDAAPAQPAAGPRLRAVG